METIEFVDAMKTGVKKIDAQHQGLVDLINKLIELKDQENSSDTISFVLSEMGKYVFVHFRDEEKYMDSHGYAGLEDHRKTHVVFEEKVLGFANKYNQGRVDLLDEILEFLVQWLVSHIKGDDCTMVKEVLASKK